MEEDYRVIEYEKQKGKIYPLFLRARAIHGYISAKVYYHSYYDRPEGEDLLGKILATNKYLLPGGLFWGIMDVTMHTNPVGWQQIVGRLLYCTWPAVGVATAFSTTSYFATKLLQKDDGWNHVAGSIAAGSVLGAWKHNPVLGLNTSLIFIVLSLCHRIKLNEGWDWFYLPENEFGDFRTHKYGWRVYKDPPKGYTTTHDEA